MTTARSIITSAMRKIGALTNNDTLKASEALDGLEMLNDLIASWSNDTTKIYAKTQENFSLSSGVFEYTIGTGATFNTARPVSINFAFVRIGTTDYPLEIVTDEDYASVAYKGSQGIPEYLNYDYGFPAGKIKIYPTPAAAYPIYILSEKELTAFASLDADVSLPPGWKRALIYSLAIEMAPEYGQQVTAEIAAIASEARGAVSSAIMRNKSLDAPRRLTGRRNIYTGYN